MTKPLLLALMPAIYPLPAPFIIPLYADMGDDAEYVSTTLSLGTVLAVVLFFFPRGVQPGISLGKGLRNRMAERRKPKKDQVNLSIAKKSGQKLFGLFAFLTFMV